MRNGYSHIRILAKRTYFHLLIIAVIGFAAYSNTFRVPYEFDDFDLIQNNLMIRNIDNFLLALKGHDFSSTAYQYSPSRFVGYFSFALNYYLDGVDVKGYHIVNLFIHIVNAFLVYYFVVLTFRTPHFTASSKGQRKDGGPGESASLSPSNISRFAIHDLHPFIALFAALLFVSHPVQTQAVTYIVQRFASLATLFYILSLLMYIKGRQSAMRIEHGASVNSLNGKSSGPLLYALCSLLFAVLAMRTKEMAYTLPAVIILYEIIFFTASLKKRLVFLLPVALIVTIVLISLTPSDKPIGEILSELDKKMRAETNMPRLDYLITEIRVIVTYIRLVLLPINQTLDYDYPIYHSLFEPPVLFSFLLLLAIFGAAVYLVVRSKQHSAKCKAQKRENFVQGPTFEVQSLEKGMQEQNTKDDTGLAVRDSRLTIDDSRFAYYRLIAFGIFWFFITLSVESSIVPIKDVISEHRVYLPSVGFLIAITAGVFLLVNRLAMHSARSDGQSGRSATRSTVSPIPYALCCLLLVLVLASATYARNNIWKDRVTFWENVVKNSPNLARPHTGLGAVYLKQGRLDEALREFQTAVSLNLSDFVAHYDIGLIYWQQGRLDEAKKEFQAAVWLRPDNPNIHNDLGKAYERQGFLDEARREYQAALSLNPNHVDARNNLEVLNENTPDKNSLK